LCVKEKQQRNKDKIEWAKFTCVGKETRAITKIFKNTDVKVGVSTDNKIGKLVAQTCDTNVSNVNMKTVASIKLNAPRAT
jgi:hypothetical protein